MTKSEFQFYFKRSKTSIWRGTCLQPCKDCRRETSKAAMARSYDAAKQRVFQVLVPGNGICPVCNKIDGWRIKFLTGWAREEAAKQRRSAAFYRMLAKLGYQDLKEHAKLVCCEEKPQNIVVSTNETPK